MIEKARTDSKIELLSHCENTEPQTNDIQPEENGVNGKHIGFLQILVQFKTIELELFKKR